MVVESLAVHIQDFTMSSIGISLAIPALDRLGNVAYAFTTRQNGLGARQQGIKTPNDWKAVANELGVPMSRVVTANQVHGETIVLVDESNYTLLRSIEADALMTREKRLAVGVETADCVPILLVDPAAPAVAAVHAGWRSTVKRIVQKTVKAMQTDFGSAPRNMIAAIGPSIGPECYEVDEAVMGPLRGTFPSWNEVAWSRENGRWSLDLAKLNRMELIQAGVPEVNVYSFGMCTCCRSDLFYSFRRDGRTGRMLSAIMIRP
jgi:YfiH family protein